MVTPWRVHCVGDSDVSIPHSQALHRERSVPYPAGSGGGRRHSVKNALHAVADVYSQLLRCCWRPLSYLFMPVARLYSCASFLRSLLLYVHFEYRLYVVYCVKWRNGLLFGFFRLANTTAEQCANCAVLLYLVQCISEVVGL